VTLVAVCATAVGCTTVSASPTRQPVPGPSVPRATGPDHPDDDRVTPPGDHAVLGTVRPEVPATRGPSAAVPRLVPRPYNPGHRDRPAVPHRRAPRPVVPTAAVRLPGVARACALGEVYGRTPAERRAARACRQANGG